MLGFSAFRLNVDRQFRRARQCGKARALSRPDVVFSLKLSTAIWGTVFGAHNNGRAKGETDTKKEKRRKNDLSRALAVPGSKVRSGCFSSIEPAVKGRSQVFPEHGVYWWQRRWRWTELMFKDQDQDQASTGRQAGRLGSSRMRCVVLCERRTLEGLAGPVQRESWVVE